MRKEEYLALAEQFSPIIPSGKKVLMVALMKWGVEDMLRILRLNDEKGPLKNLVQQGVVGESLWEKISDAEKEIEADIQEVFIFKLDFTIFQSLQTWLEQHFYAGNSCDGAKNLEWRSIRKEGTG